MRRMGGSRFVPATRFPVLVDADAVESFIDDESANDSAGYSDTVGNYQHSLCYSPRSVSTPANVVANTGKLQITRQRR